MSKDVIVVGGGISGLVSAYFLTKKGHRVTVVEKASRLGGLIYSEQLSSGLTESAANGFINTDLVDGLFKDLDLDLCRALREHKSRYFFRNQLYRFPLSWGEAQKLFLSFLPRAIFWKRGLKPQFKESVQQWGQRLLGTEATRYLLAPALQGVYAGRIDQMSAQLIYQRFFQGRKRKPLGKMRVKGLVAPKGGMYQLIEKLEAFLKEKGVRFKLDESFDYDIHAKNGEKVVVCTRADITSQIIKSRFPQVATALQNVELLPLLTVTVFYPENHQLPKGFGCLIPRGEGFQSLGVLFNGYIFEDRIKSPEIRSETWIFGGALAKDVCNWTDNYAISRVQIERIKLFHQRVEPLEWRIYRWDKALPHYNLQLEQTLSDIDPLPKGLYLVGNYMGGIGLSQLVERAYLVAEELSSEK